MVLMRFVGLRVFFIFGEGNSVLFFLINCRWEKFMVGFGVKWLEIYVNY